MDPAIGLFCLVFCSPLLRQAAASTPCQAFEPWKREYLRHAYVTAPRMAQETPRMETRKHFNSWT
jgi:hypothetical protein